MVHDLSLAVRLGVVGRAHPQGCATQAKQLASEGADKYGVAIEDDATRKPVMFAHDVEEQGCNFISSEAGW